MLEIIKSITGALTIIVTVVMFSVLFLLIAFVQIIMALLS